VVANAGVAAQLPLVGGDPGMMETMIEVNLLGIYYTVRAAAPYVAHPGGYFLLVFSLAAALHLPLMGAYNASKAGVEALGNTLRMEIVHTGARGGGLLRRAGFRHDPEGLFHEGRPFRRGQQPLSRAAPLASAVDALERGIAARARAVVAPR
jgi:hypothetical protein